jgi:hypothetical protein
MELYTEVWSVGMPNTLIATIIGIDKQLGPFRRQATSIYCKSMILGRYVTFPTQHIGTWYIMPSISKLHLQRTCPRSSCEQLVTQANTENRGPIFLHSGSDMVYSFYNNCRITRTV